MLSSFMMVNTAINIIAPLVVVRNTYKSLVGPHVRLHCSLEKSPATHIHENTRLENISGIC